MSTETNFNVAPYFDDFNAEKNYHRVLFRPEVAVQARELTQLQTILQNQVERFGDNIYQDGTIIKGCNFSFDDSLCYAKLRDLKINGQTTNPEQYVGYRVVSPSSNLQAIVIDSATGYETQNPDLNTIFIKYQNSGVGGEKQFSPGEELNFYSNTNPADSVSKVSEFTVQVAPSVIEGANTNPVGKSYHFSVSDGVIFQKGFFTNVANNLSTVVSKYTDAPDNLVVGFKTTESIVTEYDDSSLYDNASGYSNENAPGAHRLQLIPELIVADASNPPSNNFLALVEWQNGNVVRLRQQTQYSQLGRELARRTFEESGNYIVKPFTISNETIASNATHFTVTTTGGLGYIEGYRVENLNNRGSVFRRGTDTKTLSGQILNASYGNYILVRECVGSFPFNRAVTVSLRDTAGSSISTDALTVTAPGAEIGTAKIISMTHDSGTPGTADGRYRLYVSSVKMNPGRSIRDVRSIVFSSGGVSGLADTVTPVEIKESTTSLVIPTEKFAVSTLSNINYVYRTTTSGSAYQFDSGTGRLSSLNLSTGFQFPYGTGPLNSVTERRVVVVANNTVNVVTPAPVGNVTYSGNAVTGVGSTFVTDYDVGDYITINGNTKRITSITNNTFLSVSSNISGPGSLTTHSKTYPANIPIPLQDRNSLVTLSNTSSMSIQLISKTGVPEALSTNLVATVYYDVQKNASSPVTKQVLKDRFVKIDTAYFLAANGTMSCNTTSPVVTGVGTAFSSNILPNYVLYNSANVLIGTVQSVTNSTSLTLAANAAVTLAANGYKYTAPGAVDPSAGQWCLGVPDVYNVSAVYRSTGNTYSNAASSDISPLFTLSNGQQDSIYDLSHIKLSTTSANQVKNGDKLLVKFDVFRSSFGTGVGFYTKDSYPIDPSESSSNTSAIRTVDIPVFTTSYGQRLDLRNSFDFRPQVANTAVYTGSIAAATINPSAVGSTANAELYIVAPDQTFTYDATFNVGRVDKLVVNSLGDFVTVEGVPGENPVAPPDVSSGMTLATVDIKPYPSLTLLENATLNRPEYLISTQSAKHNKRYTMQDIGSLDRRIGVMEYYASLNALEQATKDRVIKSDINGQDRFKNGIFVDTFETTIPANMRSPEFKVSYDPFETTIGPVAKVSNIRLKYVSGGTKTGDVLTTPYTSEEYITQTQATKSRVCTEQLWNFTGAGYTIPGYIAVPDIVRPAPSIPWPGLVPSVSPPNYNGYLTLSVCSNVLAGSPFLTGTAMSTSDNITVAPQGWTSPFQYTNRSEDEFFDDLNRRFGVSFYTASMGITSKRIGLYWSGRIQVPETGTWTFYGNHDDGMALYVNRTAVFTSWGDGTVSEHSGSITLNAGEYYDFQLFYYNGTSPFSACTLEASGPTTSRRYVPYTWFYTTVSYDTPANQGPDSDPTNPEIPSVLPDPPTTAAEVRPVYPDPEPTTPTTPVVDQTFNFIWAGGQSGLVFDGKTDAQEAAQSLRSTLNSYQARNDFESLTGLSASSGYASTLTSEQLADFVATFTNK